jgi:hypothetical protein
MFEDNTMTTETVACQESVETFNGAFELYKLIIEEVRHLHHVWIDNFRIILTFNSILLAGAFALLTILRKPGSSYSPAFAWSLRVISFIGVVVTLIGVHIIRRTKAITSLRIREIRHLETTTLASKMSVFPFEEGALLLGMSTKDEFLKNRRNPPYPVTPLKFNPFSALGGYLLIGISFILSYLVIFILSLLMT